MMLGIKELAEGSSRARALNHLQVVLWTLTFGLIVVSAVLALRASRSGRALAALAAGCLLFEVLTLLQPPVVLGALSVVAVSGLVPWVPRRLFDTPSPR